MPQKSENKHERCVLCGKMTGYTKDKLISERKNYIDGSGQLCRDCYYEIYTKKRDEIKFVES